MIARQLRTHRDCSLPSVTTIYLLEPNKEYYSILSSASSVTSSMAWHMNFLFLFLRRQQLLHIILRAVYYCMRLLLQPSFIALDLLPIRAHTYTVVMPCLRHVCHHLSQQAQRACQLRPPRSLCQRMSLGSAFQGPTCPMSCAQPLPSSPHNLPQHRLSHHMMKYFGSVRSCGRRPSFRPYSNRCCW